MGVKKDSEGKEVKESLKVTENSALLMQMERKKYIYWFKYHREFMG